MTVSTPLSAPDASVGSDLLRTALALCPTGMLLLHPVFSGGQLTDFRFAYLNPAAQRQLSLPERPTTALLATPAETAGQFAFCQAAYHTDQPLTSPDGRLRAHRSGEVLVVSLPPAAPAAARLAGPAAESRPAIENERELALLQSLLMQAPVAIGIFRGEDHVVALANERLSALLGCAPAQVLGRPILEAVPELRGQVFDFVTTGANETTESSVGREMPVRLRRNGQLAIGYFNFEHHPLLDTAGRRLGSVVVAVEVTEQVLIRQQMQALNQDLEQRVDQRTQELEAALLEAEQQRRHVTEQRQILRQILRQVPASVATLSGPDHRYTFFNDRYEALSGHRVQVGRTVAEVFPEVVPQGFIGLLNEVYTTGEPFVGTEIPAHLYSTTTGRPESIYADFVYQPLHDATGQTTGILAFIIDSTEKVLARQAVETREHQLRLLTNSLPVLIGYLDRQQRYRFANKAYEPWFGIPPEQLLGRSVREVVGEAAYQQAAPYMLRALAGERVNFEARMPYREDLVRYIRTSYVPDMQDGTIIGFYTLVTDITEQVQARQQVQALNEEMAVVNEELQATNQVLRRTNDQLKRTNSDLDTFVYAASHDLKAPIANIEGLLEALREQLPPTVQQDGLTPQLLAMMADAVSRFQSTINHLTDVSRLQPALSQVVETVLPVPVIQDVLLDMAAPLDAAGARLTLLLDECPLVRCSAKNLRSIIYNLLSNAVKYRAPDREPLIRLSCLCSEEHVELSVHDNGLGLTTLQQSKLFVMFHRLHDHVEGSGVGLYMVKRIVENAGGTIAVESQPNVGSVFRVVLPRVLVTE